MKVRLLSVLSIAVMAIFICVSAGPPVAHAVSLSVTSVTVTGIGGAPISIWTPFALGDNQSALLAQNSGYNFDTSDFCITASNCAGPTTITVATNLGNFVFNDAAKLLAFPSVPADTNASPPLETREFLAASLTSGPGLPSGQTLLLSVGYADDAHLQNPHPACSATGTVDTPITNCKPDPFTGDIFQAIASSGGCLNASGVNDPARTCFDSGVLRLVNQVIVTGKTPEPSTIFLLGAGLLGVALWTRRRAS
jgi:hypothetical protein